MQLSNYRLSDPKYIEKLAREDHNYVKKDEVPIFIVKDKEGQNEKADTDAQKDKNTKTGMNEKKAEN